MDRPPVLVNMFNSTVSSLRQHDILFSSQYSCLYDPVLLELGPWCNTNDNHNCSAPTTVKKDQVFK